MKSSWMLTVAYLMLTSGGLAGLSAASAQGAGGPCSPEQTYNCEVTQCGGYSAPGYELDCQACITNCVRQYTSWEYSCYIQNPVCKPPSQEQSTNKHQKKT